GICFLKAKSKEQSSDDKSITLVDDRHREGLCKPFRMRYYEQIQTIQIGAVIEAMAAFNDFAAKK
ncbi:MAG: hypothetical protein AB1659_14040, partial [Thermodesulfobacteriota bacterium]